MSYSGFISQGEQKYFSWLEVKFGGANFSVQYF